MPNARPCTLSPVEPLEGRIAPASITFTDVDGVSVTITASKGSVADLQAVAIFADEGTGQELQELRLSDLPDVFQGANISIVKGTLGDTQFVNVGFINADGLDLGKVKIDGDLGRIVAGDDNSVTAAAKALTVGSIGVQGVNTQAAGGTLVSKFVGRLASLTVNGDFKEASLTVLGIDPDPDENISTPIDARGDIGDIFIGGNLIGGVDARTGYIYSKGSIGNITIVGDVLGGAGDFSASITSERNMGKVDIGGDVKGGVISGTAVSDFSGRIFSAGGMGSVKVGGELRGGDGDESGNISSAGVLGNVTIGQGIFGGGGSASGAVGTGGDIGKITVLSGGVTGGAGQTSGSILAGGDMKAVKVTGDITGGEGFQSGVIAASGNVVGASIEGSIKGGAGNSSGAVGSLQNLGAVTVTGNLEGGTGQGSGAIGCFGKLGPVSIEGNFLAGTESRSGRIAAGVSIAKVTIGGMVDGGDSFQAFEAATIEAPKIGNVSITGDLQGGDSFAAGSIVADTIGKVSIGGDIEGGYGTSSGSISARRSVGEVAITGSLIGGDGFLSGSISVESFSGMPELAAAVVPLGTVGGPGGGDTQASLGNIRIGGSILGGDSNRAGAIISSGTIKSVTVGADVVGGSSSDTGVILANDDIGSIKIGGNLAGDPGDQGQTGRIRTLGKLNSVVIEGDLIGGGGFYGDFSEGKSRLPGQIISGEAMGSVIIRGNVVGGTGSNSAMISGASIKSVLIEGDIDEGFGARSGSIVALEGNLTSLVVKGSVDLVENSQQEQSNAIFFSAADSIGSMTFGALNGTGGFTQGYITAVNTIGKVTVVNDASYFQILAGYESSSEGFNADPVNSKAKINNVVIGTTGTGNMRGVDIVAGVMASDFSGEGDNQFGTDDDTPIFPFSSDAVSRIASVVIKGDILPSNEFFGHNGIVAGQIDFVKIAGSKVPLTKALDVIELGGPGVILDGLSSGPVVQGGIKGLRFTIREVSFAGSASPAA